MATPKPVRVVFRGFHVHEVRDFHQALRARDVRTQHDLLVGLRHWDVLYSPCYWNGVPLTPAAKEALFAEFYGELCRWDPAVLLALEDASMPEVSDSLVRRGVPRADADLVAKVVHGWRGHAASVKAAYEDELEALYQCEDFEEPDVDWSAVESSPFLTEADVTE